MTDTRRLQLHLGKCIEDLDKLYNVPDLKSKRATMLCKTAQKLFESAEDAREKGDEEFSYVQYMKYLRVIAYISKDKDYLKDKTYFNSMLGSKNPNKAMDAAEKLKNSLIIRYEKEQQANRINDIQEKETMKQKMEDNKEKTNEAMVVTEPAHPGLPGPDEVSIKSEQLYSLLKSGKLKVMILDARPSHHYRESHINHPACISVPEENISPGQSANMLEQKLPVASRHQFKMTPSIGVAEFYKDKTIFLTGGTGFMGKVLVEKLLRCCPDLNKIYILMRPKKGQSTKERIDDYFNCKVFDNLQEKSPKSFDKLDVISGDILKEDLGISIEDWDRLQKETQIVYHCAACVRFDMFLRDAVNMNTVGTSKVLKLADGMEKLEVFVHVSTSYCRCEVHTLEERLYAAKHKPEDVMECVRWMDDELLTYLQPKLIEPQPNTYAYTKSLTEDLVSKKAGRYPIVIARPSIVTAAHKEPLPGWVDNLNGPTGLLVGAGKGVIRTMHCHPDYQADVVPVDFVVNACILLGYLTAIEKPKEIRICNITKSNWNPLTWGEALDMGRVHVQEFPFSICLWYPGGSAKSSKVQHLFALFFTHFLPAYFVDLLMFLMGKKTFMVKIQKRVSYGLDVLQYYTTKEWFFDNDYYRSLSKRVSEADNDVFYTNLRTINWNDYIRNYIKGAREFCCKEDPSTLPQARKLQRQLYWLDKAVQIMIYSLIAYFIYYYIIRHFTL